MLYLARSNTYFVRITAAIVLALALPLTAQAAADAGKEISTAAQHAGLAGKADSVAKVHLHLHHVINCLVGPDNDDFDEKAGNPCDGQGNGALNDIGSDATQRETLLNEALATAKSGTQEHSLDAAQTSAKKAEKTLKKAG